MAKKILLIDDDPLIVRMYERIFSFSDIEVVSALLPGDGLQKASQVKPDLILLDIMMPDMDGIEVMRRLQADELTKPIPVIILTNLSDETRSKEAMKLGAKSVMVKSDYSPKQVVEKVVAALQ
ncbi:MAG TPA: response regulator [Candidatus Saccharimonadales bacterium]|nr:response regulator [Candidatus Saccharimonadales bacterium]